MVCLGFSAAFDMVNHKILLDVLKLLWNYRASLSLDLIIPFQQEISSTNRTTVPQDSKLGPILFNCYASTLREIILESNDSFLSGYADDHAIVN